MAARTSGTGNLALDILVRRAESRLAAEIPRDLAGQGSLAEPSCPSLADFLRSAAQQDSADAGAGTVSASLACEQHQFLGAPGCIERRRSPGLGGALRRPPSEIGRRAESEFAVRELPGSATALRGWVSGQLAELREAQRAAQVHVQRQLEKQRADMDAGHARLQTSLSAALASQRDALQAHVSGALQELHAHGLDRALASRMSQEREALAADWAEGADHRWEEHLRATASKLQSFEAKVEALSRHADGQPDAGLGLRSAVHEHAAELERQRAALRDLGQQLARVSRDSQERVVEEVRALGLDARQEALEASVGGLEASMAGLEGRLLEGLERVSEALKEPGVGAQPDPERWEAHARASSSALQGLEARLLEKLAQASEQQKELREQIARVSEHEKAAREALQRSLSGRLAEEGACREARRAALQATLDALHSEHAVELESLRDKVQQLQQQAPRDKEAREWSEGAKAAASSLESLRERVDVLAEMAEQRRRADLAMQGLAAEHASDLKGQREQLQELAAALRGQQALGRELGEGLAQLRAEAERGDRSRTFTEQVMDLDRARSATEFEEEEGMVCGVRPADAGAGTRGRKDWLLHLIESEREARAELARSVEADRASHAEAADAARAELAAQLQSQLADALELAREEWDVRADEALARMAAELRAPAEAAERAAGEAAKRASFYAQELSAADGGQGGRHRDTAGLREALAAASQRLGDVEAKLEVLAEGPQRAGSSPARDAASLEALRRELREELLAEVDEVRGNLHGECESLVRRNAVEARANLAAQLDSKLDARLDSRLESRLEGAFAERLALLEKRLEAAESRGGAQAQARARQGRSPSQGRGRAASQFLESPAVAAAAVRSANAESMIKHQIS